MKLWYKKEAKHHIEALPIGNGRLGALSFGGVKRERFTLNNETLWSGGFKDLNNSETYKYLETARKLIFEEKYLEAQNLINEKMLGKWNESYMPMGDCIIDFEVPEIVEDYRRELDLDNAVVTTSFKASGIIYKREALEQLILIQAALQGNVVLKKDFIIKNSKEYGASFALLQLSKELGLDKMLYSRPSEAWVQDCLAMIIGKVVYAGSKLSLTRIAADSCLWDVCGIETEVIDVNIHCYQSMDKLFDRQDIQHF